LARSSSAAPHKRFSSSVVFAGIDVLSAATERPFKLLLVLAAGRRTTAPPLGCSFLHLIQFSRLRLAIGRGQAEWVAEQGGILGEWDPFSIFCGGMKS
jgi:hypothetical protein